MAAAKVTKYRSRKTEYRGRVYDSKREAEHARLLDTLKHASGKECVVAWEPQVSVNLIVNGVKVCRMVVDFKVEYADGSIQFHEVKGYETPVYRLKLKLLKACYPKFDLKIVR